MEFEVLKKNNKPKIIIGSLVIIALVATVVLLTSKADFQSGTIVPIVEGDIKYEAPDLNVMAIYLQSGSGVYDGADEIPQSGYILNDEKSYCRLNDEEETKLTDVGITYIDGGITVSNIRNRGTKCYIYFDKVTPVSLTVNLVVQDKEGVTKNINSEDALYVTLFTDESYTQKVGSPKEIKILKNSNPISLSFDDLNPGNYYYTLTDSEGQAISSLQIDKVNYVVSGSSISLKNSNGIGQIILKEE